MFTLKAPNNPELILERCHLVRAAKLTLEYMIEHGSIGLTKSKAFNRKFLHWAAKEFNFAGQEEEELFLVNKVLNEMDFPAAMMVHFLLKETKLARHYKDQFRITKQGEKIMNDPVALFELIVPMFLFQVDFSWGRMIEPPSAGNWDINLNVMNVELQHTKTDMELSALFFGPESGPYGRSDDYWGFYHHVLNPLAWSGLIEKTVERRPREISTYHYTKTPLWSAALKLETDEGLKPVLVN